MVDGAQQTGGATPAWASRGGVRDGGRGLRLHAAGAAVAEPGTASGGLVHRQPRPASALRPAPRPVARGKFLYAGAEKILVKGVSYGAFAPDADGREYQDEELLARDFAAMATAGFNVVRIPHTMPPPALLDIAQAHGLRVMVGLSAEQYAGYLADPRGAPDVVGIVREQVRTVAGHPALLCYALGNEIPAPMVRWIGRGRVERYLERLHDAVRDEDPDGLVTYVNYPSTEYLQLPFLDLVSFNVYLEQQDRFEAYLARLQSIAGDRPLLMSELGLDALRNGEAAQADALAWQLQSAYGAGCAGTVVFSWTDEWHRAGEQVDDWAFGLTQIDRTPKPSLAAVSAVLADAPHPGGVDWPSVSVVVCSFNGAATIAETLDAVADLDYPDVEVIVVDDGSTDETAAIAAARGVWLVRQANAGLSAARNAGMRAASGELIAYLDDDAYPDRDWLRYLVRSFLESDHAAVGGPNVPPREDPLVADAVAHAPGGPIHVLVSDTEAEHIPGCNMAFRREALAAIGGFDPQFRAAGDDVDVCWRLQDSGMTIGFSPAAVVFHHRRPSVRAYWRQQRGYGCAEALLERKWPQRYNALGHVSWSGSVYGNAVRRQLGRRRGRVYQGVWGMAPFQSLYQPAQGVTGALLLMPEWYIVVGVLLAIGMLGLTWSPLLLALPLALAGVLVSVSDGLLKGARTRFEGRSRPETRRLRLLTGALHVLQPLARLRGRIGDGLAPWRRGRTTRFVLPVRRETAVWCEDWREPAVRFAGVESALLAQHVVVARGGDYDRWDVEARGGLLGSARVQFAVEDHGAGTQYVRARIRPSWRPAALALAVALAVLAALAALDGALVAAAGLAVGAATLLAGLVRETGGASAAIIDALETLRDPDALADVVTQPDGVGRVTEDT